MWTYVRTLCYLREKRKKKESGYLWDFIDGAISASRDDVPSVKEKKLARNTIAHAAVFTNNDGSRTNVVVHGQSRALSHIFNVAYRIYVHPIN